MKNEIRKVNKIKRSSMEKAEVLEKSSKACAVFLKSEIYKNAKQIMLYMPLGNETDTTDIINRAFADGKKLNLPVTDAKTGEITPCYFEKDSEFSKGAFSIKEPCIKDIADLSNIDVILVPGIAFDRTGVRVGFGKGCYDRLLKKTSAVKVGFCYDFQLCDKIPSEEHDVKMDYIITENGIINCKK